MSSRSSSTPPANRAPTNAVRAGSVLNEPVVHDLAGAACVLVGAVVAGGGAGFSAPAGEEPCCWALPMPPPLASAVDAVVGAVVVVTAGALWVTVHVRSPLSSPTATPVSTAMTAATATARARRLVVDMLGSWG